MRQFIGPAENAGCTNFNIISRQWMARLKALALFPSGDEDSCFARVCAQFALGGASVLELRTIATAAGPTPEQVEQLAAEAARLLIFPYASERTAANSERADTYERWFAARLARWAPAADLILELALEWQKRDFAQIPLNLFSDMMTKVAAKTAALVTPVNDMDIMVRLDEAASVLHLIAAMRRLQNRRGFMPCTVLAEEMDEFMSVVGLAQRFLIDQGAHLGILASPDELWAVADAAREDAFPMLTSLEIPSASARLN